MQNLHVLFVPVWFPLGTVNVSGNSCMSLCGLVMDRRPVKEVLCLVPEVSRNWLQLPPG